MYTTNYLSETRIIHSFAANFSKLFCSVSMIFSRFLFFITFSILSLVVFSSYAQSDLLQRDLSNIKVSQISDEQLKQLIRRADEQGITDQQIETQAMVRGLPRSEAVQLRSRINRLRMEMRTTDRQQVQVDTLQQTDQDSLLQAQREISEELTEEEKKVFGYKLFNSQNLTFEPSMNIPTPENYQVGPGDELVIEIWGASEASYRLPVNRDGNIQVPNLGPIYINGLTIEEAGSIIKSRLTSIYAGLESPTNTYASVSLGTVRSIKVNLVGEVRRPGTYTLSSLSTVFNALYLSGGPTLNGTFREVHVRRNNEVVATLDVYDFVLNGNHENNILLRDQDVIWVGTYDRRVETIGEVKRPGYYEVLEDEPLSKVIEYSGGFTDEAYTHRIKITRKTGREKQVKDVSNEEIEAFTLENGDVIAVDSILDRYENRVEIFGSVFRTGEYELTEGLTVGKLIAKAEGVKEDAFLDRAFIFRKQSDLSEEVLSINLRGILSGEVPDEPLQREDAVRVLSVFDLREEFTVEIRGEVQMNGEFPYRENMTLEDLISLAGGFKESASRSRIEVARRIKNVQSTEETFQTAEIFQFEVGDDLALRLSDAQFTLQPFDQVYVRKSPAYEKQDAAAVKGEVNFPGEYVIKNKDERISDLVARAGGLTQYAHLEGAKLIRLNPSFLEEIEERELLGGDSLLPRPLRPLQTRGRSGYARNLEPETETIGIDLAEILQNPRSKYDLILQAGDTLRIPKELQTVKLSGEVLYPVSARFDESKGFSSYISQAGGFTQDADKKRSYIVYANGAVDRTNKVLFFNDYPKVKPGAEIIVPTKPERQRLSPQAWIAIASGISALTLSIVTIVDRLQ